MIYKRKMKVIERWHLRSGKLVNYPEKFRNRKLETGSWKLAWGLLNNRVDRGFSLFERFIMSKVLTLVVIMSSFYSVTVFGKDARHKQLVQKISRELWLQGVHKKQANESVVHVGEEKEVAPSMETYPEELSRAMFKLGQE
jgi:hypothetical protein